jgi:Endonuclease NucS/MrcB-like, N-terminal domain
MNTLLEILNSFITQAKTDNLKTSQYPKNFLDLKMKVSFGQGVPARIPWISLLAEEMQTSHGFYPVYLFYKNENKLILAYGISETSEFASSWPPELIENKVKISDYINNPARYGDSYVFKSYIPKILSNEKNVKFFNDDEQEVNNIRINQDLIDITNLFKKSVSLEVKNQDSVVNQGLFYMEKQLEDFIIENWDKTEFSNKYELIYEQNEMVSQQYKTGVGPIDILARDKKNKNYVVIELKKNQTSDDTVGQLLRYMGWIKETKKDENVKGIIVAGSFDKKLDYAIKMIPGSEVFLYQVDFKLKEYKK